MDETMKEADADDLRNTTATWWSETVSIADTDQQQTAPIPEEESTSRDIQLYVVIVFLSLMSVVGTAGNALVLCVFFRKRKEMAVSTLLIIVLAVVDFVTCLVVIPYTIYMESVDFHVDSDLSCKIYQFLITSNIPFSALIMVLIAVDRYLCICHPFLRILTVARAKGVIAALGIFAATLGLCVSLMFGVYQRKVETLTTVQEEGGYPTTGSFETVPLSGSWSAAESASPGNLGRQVLSATTKGTVQKQSRMVSGRSSVEPPVQPDPLLNLATGRPARETIGFTFNNESTPQGHFHEDGPSHQLENAGHCESNDLLISADFQFYYQKLYTAMYPVCLCIVIILYVLIYRSVLKRRSRRQKEKSKTKGVVRSLNSSAPNRNHHRVEQADNADRAEVHPCINGDDQHAAEIEPIMQQESDDAPKERWHGGGGGSHQGEARISKAESTRLANLKTAAMLFVVTVVFVVTFLPAFLMVLQLVPNNVIVFYLYFAYNVANPVIYSFMNQNFRNDLLKLFKSRR